MTIANCGKCGKVFQRGLSPLCDGCRQEAQQQISDVYRYLQRHPQSTLEDVAAECGVHYKELERLYFTGKLGTAASKVIYPCQRCGVPMTGIMRRGRFCLSCTEQIEAEGGVHHHSEPKEPEKPKPVSGGRGETSSSETSSSSQGPWQDTMPSANVNKPASAASNGDSYGFKRISDM